MTAPHFFVNRAAMSPGDVVPLTAEDSHHALRALRLRTGEAVTVATDTGLWGDGRLRLDEAGGAMVEISAVRPGEGLARPTVTVALAPPKGDRLAWAVQKLAEIGVADLYLIETERGVRRLGRERLHTTYQRLNRVAREASMQARRTRRMCMADHEDPAFPRDRYEVGQGVTVLLHVGAEGHLREVLPPDPATVQLLVGPEGGFTAAEVERAVAAGAVPASLGTNILRTETAAVVAAALVLHRYGRLG